MSLRRMCGRRSRRCSRRALAVETYAWVGELAELCGSLSTSGWSRSLSEFSYSIRNRKFEATIGIAREVLEDEQLGQVRIRVQSDGGGSGVGTLRSTLLFDLIAQGARRRCASMGLPFYDADAPVGRRSTFSNLTKHAADERQSGGRADVDEADSFSTMRRSDGGYSRPICWCRRSFRLRRSGFSTRRTIPEATGDGNAGKHGDQPAAGRALQIVESSRLPSDDRVAHSRRESHPVKPFIIQQRIAPEVRALDGSDGETESSFLRDVYLYGVRSRDNCWVRSLAVCV